MSGPTIGILAGMGPRSTGPFIDLVVTQCQEIYGARHDIDFPRMLICWQPAPFYEDRPTDHVALEAAIRDGLRYLESAGADFLAIACNSRGCPGVGFQAIVERRLSGIENLSYFLPFASAKASAIT